MLNNNIGKTIISPLSGTHNTFIQPKQCWSVGLFEAYTYCDADGVTYNHERLLKYYYRDTYCYRDT